jgi:hypothetical protein
MIRTRPIPLPRPTPLQRLTPLQLLGGGLLLWHIDRAVKHQRICPECANREFLAITFDVAHLWKAA